MPPPMPRSVAQAHLDSQEARQERLTQSDDYVVGPPRSHRPGSESHSSPGGSVNDPVMQPDYRTPRSHLHSTASASSYASQRHAPPASVINPPPKTARKTTGKPFQNNPEDLPPSYERATAHPRYSIPLELLGPLPSAESASGARRSSRGRRSPARQGEIRSSGLGRLESSLERHLRKEQRRKQTELDKQRQLEEHRHLEEARYREEQRQKRRDQRQVAKGERLWNWLMESKTRRVGLTVLIAVAVVATGFAIVMAVIKDSDSEV